MNSVPQLKHLINNNDNSNDYNDIIFVQFRAYSTFIKFKYKVLSSVVLSM